MLAVLATTQFTTTLEFTVVLVALPEMGRDLALGQGTLAWVLGSYAVAFGGFLLAGGRIGDAIGPRRAFVGAAAALGIASAGAAVATGGPSLLLWRGAQGLAAAVLQPAALGVLQRSFPPGPARARAVAVWGGVGAGGLAAGTVLGGILTAVSWRLPFAVLALLLLACAAAAAVLVDAPARSAAAAHVPLVATGLESGATVSLASAATVAAARGWSSPMALTGLGATALLGLAWIARARRHRQEREAGSARLPTVRLGAAIAALYMAGVGSSYFVLTLLLQTVWGYDAARGGWGVAPVAVAVVIGSSGAGWAVHRVGLALVITTGATLAAVGLGWLALTCPVGSYLLLVPGLLVSGVGNGVVFTTMFLLGTRGVPVERAATAGAVLSTAQYLSAALALATLALVLGPVPDASSCRAAFGLLTAVAGAGAVLCVTRWRLISAADAP